jgi:hypothetical protein
VTRPGARYAFAMLSPRAKTLSLAVAITALAGLGCGKIQSLLGQGDAGSSGGGGLLGGLGGGGDDELSFLSGFEGQIDLAARGKVAAKATQPGQPEALNLSLLVKDKKFRMDLPNAPGPTGAPMKGFGVLDSSQQKLFVVTDTPEKMAIVFDLNRTGEQLKGFSGERTAAQGAKAPSKPPPKVTKTGRKDKVAGYTCEDWEIASEDGTKVAICVAGRGFSWLKIPMLGAPAEYAWMAELLDGSRVPLRAIMFEKDGREGGRVEVTKIEKKTVPPNAFEIPPGYPQMTLEQMIAKAMSGLGGPGGRMPPGAFPGGAPPGFPPGAFPPGAAPKGAKPTPPPR